MPSLIASIGSVGPAEHRLEHQEQHAPPASAGPTPDAARRASMRSSGCAALRAARARRRAQDAAHLALQVGIVERLRAHRPRALRRAPAAPAGGVSSGCEQRRRRRRLHRHGLDDRHAELALRAARRRSRCRASAPRRVMLSATHHRHGRGAAARAPAAGSGAGWWRRPRRRRRSGAASPARGPMHTSRVIGFVGRRRRSGCRRRAGRAPRTRRPVAGARTAPSLRSTVTPA